MDSLVLLPGGRPFTNDDLQTLQGRDTLLGLPALLQGLGPCIVSGCTLTATGTTYTVSSGMVWANGVLLDFLGASNVTLPAVLVAGTATTTDSRPYRTGSTQAARQQRYITLLQSNTPQANAVFLQADGAVTIWDRIQQKTRELNSVEYVTDTTGYDQTGKGLGSKRGWALANGQNGTIDLRGKFLLAAHSTGAPGLTPRNVGQGGGEETHTLDTNEMPQHTHGMQSAGAHTHSVDSRNGDGNNLATTRRGDQAGNDGNVRTSSGGAHTHSINDAGGGQAHNNMPPFHVLALRQWIGF